MKPSEWKSHSSMNFSHESISLLAFCAFSNHCLLCPNRPFSYMCTSKGRKWAAQQMMMSRCSFTMVSHNSFNSSSICVLSRLAPVYTASKRLLQLRPVVAVSLLVKWFSHATLHITVDSARPSFHYSYSSGDSFNLQLVSKRQFHLAHPEVFVFRRPSHNINENLLTWLIHVVRLKYLVSETLFYCSGLWNPA